jgi:hypothetical protein
MFIDISNFSEIAKADVQAAGYYFANKVFK